VTAVVKFARETGVPLAVRSGGHSFPGLSTYDPGNLFRLNQNIRPD
jgi:FAD/FMN-containing dehydrogenase